MEPKIVTFDILLEIPQTELLVFDTDIDFIVRKSVFPEPDTALLNIWNLDENLYRSILQKPYLIKIYSEYSDEEKFLLFSGYIDSDYVKRSRVSGRFNSFDMITELKLTDSRTAYEESFINETYRENISSTQIINDCIDAAGLGSVILNSEIPEKIYNEYKATGKPHLIIKRLCEALKIPFLIRNGVIYLGKKDSENTVNNMPELDLNNSLEPKFQGDNTVLVITKFLPEIIPGGFVKCNFENFSGEYPVFETEFSGNNYDTVSSTQLVMGI